jgi:hypothetical protein
MLHRIAAWTEIEKDAVPVEQGWGKIFYGKEERRMWPKADGRRLHGRPHRLNGFAHLNARQQAEALVLITQSEGNTRLRYLDRCIQTEGKSLAGSSYGIQLCPVTKNTWLGLMADKPDSGLRRPGKILLNIEPVHQLVKQCTTQLVGIAVNLIDLLRNGTEQDSQQRIDRIRADAKVLNAAPEVIAKFTVNLENAWCLWAHNCYLF